MRERRRHPRALQRCVALLVPPSPSLSRSPPARPSAPTRPPSPHRAPLCHSMCLRTHLLLRALLAAIAPDQASHREAEEETERSLIGATVVVELTTGDCLGEIVAVSLSVSQHPLLSLSFSLSLAVALSLFSWFRSFLMKVLRACVSRPAMRPGSPVYTVYVPEDGEVRPPPGSEEHTAELRSP